jgi:hypothetical protein
MAKLHNKMSPKNSDYIKNSILRSSSNKKKKIRNIIRESILEEDECPSFFNELEFDEDHATVNKNFQTTVPTKFKDKQPN